MRSLSAHALLTLLLSGAAFFSAVMADSPLDLGLAEPYAILAGSTVTSTGTDGTVVNGNIGIFPGTALTGFPPAVLNGALDSANGASGGAQGSLTIAYNALAGKQFDTTLSNTDLGGMTLLPGVYKFDEAAAMNGMLTLDAAGDTNAIWTFQVGSSLLIAEGSSIIFKDSIGNPDFVYWQVGTRATIAIGVPMIGNILALDAIIVNDGATVKGRCLARNAEVTLDRSVITKPTTVSFHATQTISGLSLDQYLSDEDNNEATLKQAIAHTMTNVAQTNIENFDVTAGPTSAAVATSLRATIARALATDSIVLDYDVIVSSTMTAQELGDQLTAAVNDGSFDTYLHSVATDNGATYLESTTSDTIDTQPIITDDSPSSSDCSDSSTLSGGAIAGIVIGGVVALVLIALIIYYFTCHAAGHQSSAVPK